MKSATIAILVLTLSAAAFAEPGGERKRAFAESASACLMNCANQSDSCKRLCPTTYNGPCTAACDNQAQFCRQACQEK
jgi:hypothetical protein